MHESKNKIIIIMMTLIKNEKKKMSVKCMDHGHYGHGHWSMDTSKMTNHDCLYDDTRYDGGSK